MTVLDTSVVVDALLGRGVADEAQRLLATGPAAAPGVLVFEVVTVLRRAVLRGSLASQRGAGAIEDLGDLAIDLFPDLALRERAWALRDSFTAADALFVSLAERLDEPLATRDAALAAAARRHAGVAVIELAENG